MSKLTLLLVLLSIPAIASAGVPDPRFSSVPSCWTLCPNGDLSVTVTIRDVSNAPQNSALVWIDLCSCPSVHLCPASPQDGYTVNGCQVSKRTNASGQATFALRGGGGCLGPAPVYADGILMATVTTIASADQDGDLDVDVMDHGLVHTKHGTADRTGDLTCDGVVNFDDDPALQVHLRHVCTNPTPALPLSWGRMRVLYR